MKKIQLSGLIILTAIIVNACGGGQPPPPPPEEPAEDTTTYIPEDTIPPEPEVRTISESEFVTVYFDFDKSHIKPEFETAIENNAALMKESMDMIVKVEGHCDERGTTEYNQALGERRAISVKNYLMNLGIAEGRIQTNSWGKERPAATGNHEAAWSKNRRVEFIIVSQ
ncbi:MAG: peptidoglycan-associated lipoprotein Pal [candidate division Zixibacteria bacterium]|nr:peptidoglycan-associated lipoprotein Pal [candidate division Zixibacteria bacterium]